MPIYEYECKKCHHVFERIQKFSDPPLKKCPECRAGRLEKLLSPPAVHFKGTGWYVTDYARKGSGDKGKDKEGKSDKESGKESDKKAASADSSSKSKSTNKEKKKS